MISRPGEGVAHLGGARLGPRPNIYQHMYVRRSDKHIIKKTSFWRGHVMTGLYTPASGLMIYVYVYVYV